MREEKITMVDLSSKTNERLPIRRSPLSKRRNSTRSNTKVVLLNKQEEYSTGEEDSESDDDSSSEVAAIATTSTSTSSLFDSPNENLINKNANCFMARASEVSPSISSSSNSTNGDKDDATSFKMKEELVALDYFLSNVQGESKKHFEAILRQLAEANARLEEKVRLREKMPLKLPL